MRRISIRERSLSPRLHNDHPQLNLFWLVQLICRQENAAWAIMQTLQGRANSYARWPNSGARISSAAATRLHALRQFLVGVPHRAAVGRERVDRTGCGRQSSRTPEVRVTPGSALREGGLPIGGLRFCWRKRGERRRVDLDPPRLLV
eukprot:6207974-Pleurochrysis_carterae.AAC.1